MPTSEAKYPALGYLIPRARRRVPFFAWEYLASGTGAERLVGENRAALDRVLLPPKVAQGRYQPDTSTSLFGKHYSVPFGAAPVGMSGLIWPGAELILARAARENGFPYTLSMVANETPEAVAEAGGENAWFQLYPLKEPEIEDDLLARAASAGIRTLVVTLDVPVGSRRERQLAAGLTVPPKVTPLTLWRVAQRPVWALKNSAAWSTKVPDAGRIFPRFRHGRQRQDGGHDRRWAARLEHRFPAAAAMARQPGGQRATEAG
ncbi:alpha-hydroxy acid oxidase [Phaeobacter sp. J2-8]|uniref:alpha-hydroxy acid oxidase n=1 Tax=Phaeobacter sp. J2-8 TaxID=2931394 RepID=UPI0032AEC93D